MHEGACRGLANKLRVSKRSACVNQQPSGPLVIEEQLLPGMFAARAIAAAPTQTLIVHASGASLLAGGNNELQEKEDESRRCATGAWLELVGVGTHPAHHRSGLGPDRLQQSGKAPAEKPAAAHLQEP